MRRKDNFLENAPLWKIYLAGWFVTGFMTFIVWGGLSKIGTDDSLIYTFPRLFCFGAIFGIPFGLLFTLMISMGRKSTKFWEHAEYVEKLVDEANSKIRLDDIFKCEFEGLKDLSQGGPHSQELNRIYTIMKTKYKFLK